ALVALLVPLLAVWQRPAGFLDPSAPLLFLVPVLLASAISGAAAGVLVSGIAVLVWDWYFIPPIYHLGPFDNPHAGLALLVFVAVAILVGQLNYAARRRTATLQRSQGRYRTLIEAAPIGICTTDEQARFVTVNDAYCALTGYARQELIGAP